MKFIRIRYLPTGRGQRMFLHSLSSFLCKHCICGHKCDYSIVDMPSLRSARYICLAANSICFRYAQARYDIDPRSRSEHIECVSTYRTRQRISKIRASGSISTRSVLKGTTLRQHLFCRLKNIGKNLVGILGVSYRNRHAAMLGLRAVDLHQIIQLYHAVGQ